jgi:hypothetical protein
VRAAATASGPSETSEGRRGGQTTARFVERGEADALKAHGRRSGGDIAPRSGLRKALKRREPHESSEPAVRARAWSAADGLRRGATPRSRVVGSSGGGCSTRLWSQRNACAAVIVDERIPFGCRSLTARGLRVSRGATASFGGRSSEGANPMSARRHETRPAACGRANRQEGAKP